MILSLSHHQRTPASPPRSLRRIALRQSVLRPASMTRGRLPAAGARQTGEPPSYLQARRSPWLTGLEWEFLAGRDALLRHCQDHRNGHVGTRYGGEINDLLLAEVLPGAIEALLRDGMPGCQLGNEIIHGFLFGRHVRRPPVLLELRHDLWRQPSLDGKRDMSERLALG